MRTFHTADDGWISVNISLATPQKCYCCRSVSNSGLDFATRLRIIRIMLNRTQSGLAEELAVTRETLCAWETGLRLPRVPMQRMITIHAEREGVVLNERGYPEYAQRQSSEPSA